MPDIGRFSSKVLQDDEWFVVRQRHSAKSAMSGIYGTAMATGGRGRGPKPLPLLATPGRTHSALFLGRSLPLIANGIIVSRLRLRGRLAAPRFQPSPWRGFPALALVVGWSAHRHARPSG